MAPRGAELTKRKYYDSRYSNGQSGRVIAGLMNISRGTVQKFLKIEI